tara:strand:+ start:505 stop:621 length:117 start_codon:yes stop_codon:yes gene_type:complete
MKMGVIMNWMVISSLKPTTKVTQLMDTNERRDEAILGS